MSKSKEVHEILLLPGLAADKAIFKSQRIRYPQLQVPEWLAPEDSETLDQYAGRLAEPFLEAEHLIIGGASFGGIVALHMAKYLKPTAVVLIGSIRSPDELPFWLRLLSRCHFLVGCLPVGLLQLAMRPFQASWFRKCFPFWTELARQFIECDAKLFRWSVGQLLTWDHEISLNCVVYRVHGWRDCVLPAKQESVDLMVNGGHVISMTNSTAVNEFIARVIRDVSK